MKKKGLKKVTGMAAAALMMAMLTTTALASSFSLGSTSGTNSLTKTSEQAQGKITFGAGKSVTAVRYVKVTLKCSKGGTTYEYTDSDTASTSAGNYTDTTASVTVYRPSSSYTVTGATSYHKTTSGQLSNEETIRK